MSGVHIVGGTILGHIDGIDVFASTCGKSGKDIKLSDRSFTGNTNPKYLAPKKGA